MRERYGPGPRVAPSPFHGARHCAWQSPLGFPPASGRSAHPFPRRAPGNFAVWGGLFSVFDCTLTAVRHKEDPWNSIISGTLTGAALSMRGAAAAALRLGAPASSLTRPLVPRPAGGWKAAARNGVIGGVLLAFIEGLGVAINHWMAEAARKAQFEAGQGVHGPSRASRDPLPAISPRDTTPLVQ